VKANQIIFSLILFGLVYLTLFALFIYLLNKKIKHGPVSASETGDIHSNREERITV
jgi:cytochrome d ubiquinol oxidase subunit I